MKKRKILTIFGTRPEASKMAPVIHELKKRSALDVVVCVTAQHRAMLDQTLRLFQLTPDYDLDIMRAKQTLTDITVRAIQGIEAVLIKEKPDLTLVHGDTSTTFAASLAAFYQKVSVGHVEAGLRTFDNYQPFPEEMNRKLTGALADLHFSPTLPAKQNLLNEGVRASQIFVTGNTAIDAVLTTARASYRFEHAALNQIDYEKTRVIVMTAHRRENIGEPLERICRAAKRIVADNPDVTLIYAVHLNPLVQETAKSILAGQDRILLTDPLSLLDLHNLMRRSVLVLTDSGGLQEEAPALHKPVVVLRNVTERPEGAAAGTLKLAGTDEQTIYETVCSLLRDRALYDTMAAAKNPFGDGQAARRIADAILYHFGYAKERPADFTI